MKKLYIFIAIILHILISGVSAQTHFTKVWDGNGIDHMNFYITPGAQLEVQLNVNDEVAIFDGDLCVGLTKLSKPYTTGDYIAVEASKDDNITPSVIDGYTTGNSYSLKIWDASEARLVESLVDTLFAGHDVFALGGAATLVIEQAFPIPTVYPLPVLTGECSLEISTYPGAVGYFGDDIVATTYDPLSYSTIGNHQIVWEYEDNLGNSITQTQLISVIDTTSPIIQLDTLPLLSNRCVVEVSEIPQANDACMGVIKATTHDPLIYNEVGEYTITWNFNDGNGNITRQQQAIEVTDYTPPIEVSGDTTIFPGQTIGLYAFGGDFYLWSTGEEQQYIDVTTYKDTSYIVKVIKDGCTAFDTVTVTMKATPDIIAFNVIADQSNYQPGDSIQISWTVKNIGDVQAYGGWNERVALRSETGDLYYFNRIFQNNQILAVNDSVQHENTFKIPGDIPFNGNVTPIIELIPHEDLFERLDALNNNTGISEHTISINNSMSFTFPALSFEELYYGSIWCLVTRSGNRDANLQVTFTLSDQSTINIPQNVTIPAGSASSSFYITLNDNSIVDGNRQVVLTASAPGFNNEEILINILDNEIPSLSLTLSEENATEGDTIMATLNRDLVTSEELIVNISSDNSSQFSIQETDTIRASETSSVFPIVIIEDSYPELIDHIIVSATKAGYNAGRDTITIYDNDIPEIELEILTDTISESSGLFAAWAVIRRTENNGETIKVQLQADQENTLFIPSMVQFDPDDQEKRINFGAYDNTIVDNFRSVVITASIYINSCNCSTTNQEGGTVSDTIVIADNDGPTLSCSFKSSSLTEGIVNKSSLEITRNTTTTEALTVYLSCKDTSEVELPESVTIPVGNEKVVIDVVTKDDGIKDGEQVVTVMVASEGYSPGSAWIIVTDENTPDLHITDVTIESDTAIVSQSAQISVSVTNIGLLEVPDGTRLYVYLSKNTSIDNNDLLLSELFLDDALAVGDTLTVQTDASMPERTGKYYILAEINPYREVTEILYNNNQYSYTPITLMPSYTGTASVDIDILNEVAPVEIYGEARFIDGTLAAYAALDVYILNNGTQRSLRVITDENGNYRTTFNPYTSEAGHYMVGACYPQQGLIEVHDEFDILGIRRTSNKHVIWDVKRGIAQNGSIEFENLSSIPLTNLTFNPVNLPKGLNLNVNTIDELPGSEKLSFNYSIEGAELTDGFDYEAFDVVVNTNEGISETFKVYYFCQNPSGHLKTVPTSIQTNITKGYVKSYEVILYNDGAGETGKMTPELPDVDWLRLVSNDTIESLSPGEQMTLLLEFVPGEEIPLNTPISGNIAINIGNGHGVSIPYRIEAVSEAKGSLTVDVLDEYSYYAEGTPHVKDAHITIRHPFSGKIVAEGFTNSDGLFELDRIAEGSYRITVESEQHEGYQNILEIKPGIVNEHEVYISFQAISYTWEVVPTEIEDEYEVELVMEYETNVPVPVVVIEMPKEMPPLYETETYPFLVTVTNKGLITAEDVTLEFPEDPEYEFVTNYEVMDLMAQQAIQVPVVMRRKDAFLNLKSAYSLDNYGTPIDAESRLKSTYAISSDSELKCKEYLTTIYGWHCGKDKRWHRNKVGYTFRNRDCGENEEEITNTGIGTYNPRDYSGWYNNSSDSNGGGSSGSGDSLEYTYEPSRPHPVIVAAVVGTALVAVAASKMIQACDPCLTSMFIATGSCIPGLSYAFNTVGCLQSFLDQDGVTFLEIVICGGTFLETASGGGCIVSFGGALNTCYKNSTLVSESQETLKSASDTDTQGGKIPPILEQSYEDLLNVDYASQGIQEWMDEFVGGTFDWQQKQSFVEFASLVDTFINNRLVIPQSDIANIKNEMQGKDIVDYEIDAFTSRWNKTNLAWKNNVYSPDIQNPDIIDNIILENSIEKQDSAMRYAEKRGYSSLGEMYNEAIYDAKEYIEEGEESVCASVSISIKQKVTMTREAFEGTLTITNGHFADPMLEVELNLDIRNEQGEPSNDLFHIETKALDMLTGIEGDGVLNAGAKGSATILFIPEKSAAPKIAHSYSFGGSFSYLDPFTGTTVTRELFPVTLEVHPSPDMHLHYFMQRTVLGDDPLTEGIEPSIPAELALMIENDGYGTAKNVLVESAQPEIIENEKGLSIHFELIGSSLQGDSVNLGLNNISFGQIDSLSTKIGQWWMTCDLLGHFINYETRVTHLDSRGNPDLSLINGATLHELIKSVDVYGDKNDSINDFLVNEIQDINETPDAIYLSQGNEVLDVFEASNGAFNGVIRVPTLTNELTITPSFTGWHYIKLNDPGEGNFELEKITRNLDGQEIPIKNGWLTHVTLPDDKEPVYENKFHFIDEFMDGQPQTYTIAWKEKDPTPVEVLEIHGVPTSMISYPLSSLQVEFNEPIDESSFSIDDMVLRYQGGDNIMNDNVKITKVDETIYELDISTVAIGDGFYALTVNTNNILNPLGRSGLMGKQASWTQVPNVPAIESVVGLPYNNIGSLFDTLLIKFNRSIDVETLVSERFSLAHDGDTTSLPLLISPRDETQSLFHISGLQPYMLEGENSLIIDLPGIRSSEGVAGLFEDAIDWFIDTTNPELVQFEKKLDRGVDSQHVTGIAIEFSEPILGFDLNDIELWKDGTRQPLSAIDLDSVSPSTYNLSKLRMLTYYEGTYTLKVSNSTIHDLGQNQLNETNLEYSWTVDRTPPQSVSNLRISPDLGYSNSDGVTSESDANILMHIPESNIRIELYEKVAKDNRLLKDTVFETSGPVSVPVDLYYIGSIQLTARSIDENSNYSETSIDIFLDQAELLGEWVDVTCNPDSVSFVFYDDISETQVNRDAISLKNNGLDIDIKDLTIEIINDSIITLYNIEKLKLNNGIYSLGIDMSEFHKYSSGLLGTRVLETSFEIINNPPDLLNNIEDKSLESGFASYSIDIFNIFSDPDDDALMYTAESSNESVVTVYIDETTLTIIEVGIGSAIITLSANDGRLSVNDQFNVEVNVTTDIKKQSDAASFSLYPNPTARTVYLMSAQKISSNVLVKVTDIRGTILKVSTLEGIEVSKTENIDLSALPKGIYFINLESKEINTTVKVVKQ